MLVSLKTRFKINILKPSDVEKGNVYIYFFSKISCNFDTKLTISICFSFQPPTPTSSLVHTTIAYLFYVP